MSEVWVLDDDEARTLLDTGEFVFDVQTHHVNPQGAWRSGGDQELPTRLITLISQRVVRLPQFSTDLQMVK